MKSKWPYFGNAWGYSQMVGRAGSPTGIVHADVTLTRSKVKVMGLLNFLKLWLWLQLSWKKPCVLAAMTISPLPGFFTLYILTSCARLNRLVAPCRLWGIMTNEPSIHLLILMLCILFACLHHLLLHLSFFLQIFLIYSLTYLFLENRPTLFPGRMS